MSWTQPICKNCYTKDNPDREPLALQYPERENCCKCGELAVDGIYIRIDPESIPYPKVESGAMNDKERLLIMRAQKHGWGVAYVQKDCIMIEKNFFKKKRNFFFVFPSGKVKGPGPDATAKFVS